MKRIQRAIDVIFNNVTKRDFDSVILITGDEGLGKSHLGLHIIDYWYTKLYGFCEEENIKHIALDMSQFTNDLKDLKKYEALVYDEAGDISNKRSMSTVNVLLTQAYQVIRGDNLLTILILPSPFDIDGFFTKRRARGLFHVTKRGSIRYYSKNRLRKIIEKNQRLIVKKIGVVPPSFVDTYPKYKGLLLEPYKKKKFEKMSIIRKELADKMKNINSNNKKNDDVVSIDDFKIYEYWKKKGTKSTAEKFDKSERTIQRRIKMLRQVSTT